MSLWRTWLYVPAHNTGQVTKALASAADCVVLDLEDAVPRTDKDLARASAITVIQQEQFKPVLIRINAHNTPWHEADLAAVAAADHIGPGFAGVRIPKAEDPAQIGHMAEMLGPNIPVHLLLESAVGLANLQQLAQQRVNSIALGEADLRSDLAWTSDCALDPVRVQLTIAARAAHLPRPPASVFTNVTDIDGLTASTQHLKSLGFFGRSVIHPSQIDPVNRIFSPTRQEIDAAHELLQEVSKQGSENRVAFIQSDGSFIDPALIRQAHSILDLEQQLAAVVEGKNS
ncbi:MAG: CoA ester lyase [Candidatus Nanopelagicales bacterium]|nr:CoA ester lyase [Candidatus Nanopelagicales bacterium]